MALIVVGTDAGIIVVIEEYGPQPNAFSAYSLKLYVVPAVTVV